MLNADDGVVVNLNEKKKKKFFLKKKYGKNQGLGRYPRGFGSCPLGRGVRALLSHIHVPKSWPIIRQVSCPPVDSPHHCDGPGSCGFCAIEASFSSADRLMSMLLARTGSVELKEP